MKPSRLGIEIGGTKIQVVLGDVGHTIRDRRRFVVDRSQGAAGIRAQIEEAIRSFQTSGALFEGVGVGFGGPVNRKQGMVACSHQIQDWEGFALAACRESKPLPILDLVRTGHHALLAVHRAAKPHTHAFEERTRCLKATDGLLYLGADSGSALGSIHHKSTPIPYGMANIPQHDLYFGSPNLDSQT